MVDKDLNNEDYSEEVVDAEKSIWNYSKGDIDSDIDSDGGTEAVEEFVEEDAGADSEDEDLSSESEEKASKTKMELYDWLQCIVGAIIVGIFIFVFIGRTIGVDGNSMYETLHNNDRVIMSNLFYTPRNGDIIVFKARSHGDTPLVKRVIATEGQTININFADGHVFVDGILLCEPYINEPTRSEGNFRGQLTVGEGKVFVMGDNRNHSNDSRSFGEVDTRYILGKVLFMVIPGGDDSSQRDWGRFGFVGTNRNCPPGQDCVCYAVHQTPLSDCSCEILGIR